MAEIKNHEPKLYQTQKILFENSYYKIENNFNITENCFRGKRGKLQKFFHEVTMVPKQTAKTNKNT